jgi:hypothetical protein
MLLIFLFEALASKNFCADQSIRALERTLKYLRLPSPGWEGSFDVNLQQELKPHNTQTEYKSQSWQTVLIARLMREWSSRPPRTSPSPRHFKSAFSLSSSRSERLLTMTVCISKRTSSVVSTHMAMNPLLLSNLERSYKSAKAATLSPRRNLVRERQQLSQSACSRSSTPRSAKPKP